MKQIKKTLILSIVAIVALAALVVGATYAYFQAEEDTSKSVDIRVSSSTTDVFTFLVGDDINISAYQSNFAEGQSSLSGTTTASAKLIANNGTNSAKYNYYVYVDITSNTFAYSIGKSNPELILTVIGPDGNEVTSLAGLTHTTAKDNKGASISGFDVTTTSGLITIANNKEIVAGTSSSAGTSETTENYTVTLTFVNYNDDQTINAGASLNAEIKIQKEKIVYHESCNDSLLACKVAKNYTGTQGENSIYYHNGTITSDDGTVIDAGDNSYRYAGASSTVNNYVCFGSDAEACPTDNLYRIIGVIDGKVKLIKSTSLGSMKWDSKNSNTWSTSSLNTYLNGTYLDTFSKDWQAKIAKTTWKVGGISSTSVTAATMYTNEMNSTASGTDGLTEYPSKVALMYAHDYGFAASPTAWTKTVYNYNGNDSAGTSITTINWLYLGSNEWLVSHDSSYSTISFRVHPNGGVDYLGVDYHLAVRPVFYLTSLATYLGGVGTSDNPYRLG